MNEYKSQNIAVMYTNADSLFNKLTELKLMISIKKPAVIAITEVKHKRNWQINTSEFSIDNYSLYTNNLDLINVRGVAVYVHNSVKSKILDYGLEVKDFIAVEIECEHDKLLVCNIYRSPASLEEDDKNLNSLITHVCKNYKGKKLFVGDFNYNDVNWVTWETESAGSRSNHFIKMLRNNFLIQEVDKPNRARGDDKPSILDLVITDDLELVQDIEDMGPLGKSDHSILNVVCCIQNCNKLHNDKMNYNKGNYEEFRQFMNIDWDKYLYNCDKDIDKMWYTFKSKVDAGVLNFIPKVSTFGNWKKSKWKMPLSLETRSLINQKRKMWRKYINNRSAYYLNRFKELRNKIRNETRKIQKLEQSEVAKNCKSNPKKFWNYVRSKSNMVTSIGDIKVKGNEQDIIITDDDAKAQTFCDYFSSVFTEELSTNIPTVLAKNCTFKNSSVIFSESVILDKLNKLNTTKSPGPDAIHPRILYELREYIVYPLKLLFDESYKQKKLPMDWRSANITALFKKGSRSNVSNYRPVSLTSIICKIMESVVRDNINKHFLDNNFFSKKQFGFIKGRSTVSQLLKMLDDWTEQLENGGHIDVVYSDFEKAFDKVPHKRLINKLTSYGLDSDTLEWIKAFLCFRKQRVKLNGKFSDWSLVLSGIPQGSILGPLLFIIFINDLPEFCENSTDIYLFADDAKISKLIRSQSDQQLLQQSVDKIQQWSDKWKLKLNINKCKVVCYGRDRSTQGNYHMTIENKDIILEQVDHFKDLGVIFDNHLSFQHHSNEKINKAYSILGIIKRNFTYLTPEALVQIYKSMVRSHLEYAQSVWYPYRHKLIDDLEKVQKRATKLVPSLRKLSYSDRLKWLKLPTLKYRRYRGDMIEVYKIISGKYDNKTVINLDLVKDTRTRGNVFKLKNKSFHYDIRKFAFSVRIVNVWNSLPNKVVEADTVDTFKRRLDKFWADQDIIYDYKADLTGLTSRSHINI